MLNRSASHGWSSGLMPLKMNKKKDKNKDKNKDLSAAERANVAAGKGAGVEAPETPKEDTAIAKTKKAPVDILPPLSEEEQQVKAVENDSQFRELEASTRKGFVAMGMILREMQAYALHRFILNPKGKAYTSFDSWLKDAAPLSRASGYSALRVAERLLPIIPRKELESYPRYSLELMAKIPRIHLENPTIRQAARTSKSRNEMVTAINSVAPEAHIEQIRRITIEASADSVIGDAWQAAQAIGQVDEKNCLEFICTSWLDSLCETEEYAGMSNRQAWESWKTTQPEAVKARVTEGENESLPDTYLPDPPEQEQTA